MLFGKAVVRGDQHHAKLGNHGQGAGQEYFLRGAVLKTAAVDPQNARHFFGALFQRLQHQQTNGVYANGYFDPPDLVRIFPAHLDSLLPVSDCPYCKGFIHGNQDGNIRNIPIGWTKKRFTDRMRLARY